jgi:hypothetical protein
VQNGTTWTQQAELTVSDGAAHDRSLLAAVAAMAMVVGLRRQPRRAARVATPRAAW